MKFCDIADQFQIAILRNLTSYKKTERQFNKSRKIKKLKKKTEITKKNQANSGVEEINERHEKNFNRGHLYQNRPNGRDRINEWEVRNFEII